MARALKENRLSREIKNLAGPKLLIIDEVGYLTLETAHASLLLQAICECYEKQQAIVLTSNKAFADWARSSPATPSWPPPPWTAGCTAPR
jgi:DNA replication protein DnaC